MLTKIKHFEYVVNLNEMIVSTKVDNRALTQIRKCFTQIVTNWGFFADLLFQLKIMEVPKSFCETMCTDGKAIGYCADFVNKLTESEVTFVIIHEIMHNANFHFNRQGVRNGVVWNYAGDYAINLLINDMASGTNLLKAPNKVYVYYYY